MVPRQIVTPYGCLLIAVAVVFSMSLWLSLGSRCESSVYEIVLRVNMLSQMYLIVCCYVLNCVLVGQFFSELICNYDLFQ